MTFPAALPHDLPEEIAENVFLVKGCVKPNPVVRFTRNMVVIREGQSLTLINPVRMETPGLEALDKLGKVEHILRLGPMHGMDDPFYVDRYNPRFWSFTDHQTYTEPAVTDVLSADAQLPFSNASLFVFDHMKETEGAILLDIGPGLLITCDGIQSYATAPHTPHTNAFTRFMMPFIGFPKKTLIGPVWVKLLVEDVEGIKREFQRLMTLEFDQLIAAHGTFLSQGAKQEVQQAYDKMFG